MNVKKRFHINIVLLITALIFLTGSLSAQQKQEQGPPPIPNETQINKMVEDLSAELSLREGQKIEILALYQNHFTEVKSSMSSGQRPSREDMESLKEEFEDEVKNLLNAEQQDLYEEFIKKNKPQNRQDNQRPQRK